MNNEQTKLMGASAQYRGCTLTLAQGKKAPVILVINHSMTTRPDGVVDIVANPRLAKGVVDRRLGMEKKKQSMSESAKILSEGRATDLAAAMMSSGRRNLLS